MAHGRKWPPDVAVRGGHGLHDGAPSGPPSALTCPDCGGALWENVDERIVSFRCHVGHTFTAESLMLGQDDGVESALWSALRALEEQAALRRWMAHHARVGELLPVARRYEQHAASAEGQADVVRAILTGERTRSARREPAPRRGGRPAARTGKRDAGRRGR